MHAHDDPPSSWDALDSLADLEWTAPGSLLVLLKLLALGALWAVHQAKRRRNRALRRSIDALTAHWRASAPASAVAPVQAAAFAPSPRRTRIRPARR